METFVTCAIPVLLGFLLVKTLLLPLKAIFKVAAYSVGGLLCLWLLNSAAHVTGVCLPINPVTVFIAGFGGIPGIGLISLLELV